MEQKSKCFFTPPEYTPTPNVIFDHWMARLKGSELKVLLCVVRHTLGWIEDEETGRRRELDSICHRELEKQSGVTGATITRAMAVLIDDMKIVQALDENFNVLDTPAKRRTTGRKRVMILYRLVVRELDSKWYEKNNAGVDIENGKNEGSHYHKNEGQVLKKEKTKEKQTSEDKPRGEVSYPAEWYRKNEDDYQRIKGITLEGPEFAPLQQALKSMYMANRTPDQICDLMEAFERSTEGWTDNWTYSTVKTKMAEFVAGKLSLGKSSPASSNPHSEIIAQRERLRTLWNECSYNIKEIEDEAKRHNRALTPEEHNQIAVIQDKQREYEERGLRLKERLESL